MRRSQVEMSIFLFWSDQNRSDRLALVPTGLKERSRGTFGSRSCKTSLICAQPCKANIFAMLALSNLIGSSVGVAKFSLWDWVLEQLLVISIVFEPWETNIKYFLKNGPIPTSLCLFSSFSHYNFSNTNWKMLRLWPTATKPRSHGGRPTNIKLTLLVFSMTRGERLMIEKSLVQILALFNR